MGSVPLLTIFELYLMSYSELTKRMFSGFRSVCVSLFLWRTETQRIKEKQKIKSAFHPKHTKKDAIKQYPWLTSDCSDDLVGHVPDVVDREGLKVIFLQKIIRAQAQQLKGNADVPVVIKPVIHPHTSTRERKKWMWITALLICSLDIVKPKRL